MMKKIKTFKTFESNYIHDLFKDSHSALDLSKLIPIKKVINKKGHPTQQDINDIIDFVNLDPNFIYYDPNNSLYPYIYWKDFIYLEFFGTLSLEAAKMMMLDKRLNYQQNKFDEFLSKKDYDTAFQLADKRIVIPLYIKLFNDIPDNQKYEVFIYLYMRPEFVAVLVVILLLPTRTDAQHEPAVRDVVDGACHVGQQFRVAIGVAGHQRADRDAGRLLGPRSEHGPALEVRAVGVAVQREEMVPVEDDVHTHVFAAAHSVADLPVVRGVLGLQLHPDADGKVGSLGSLGSHGISLS